MYIALCPGSISRADFTSQSARAAAEGFLGSSIFTAGQWAFRARQGDVVIGDDMTAQSRDYQGFAPFFQPISANHNRQD